IPSPGGARWASPSRSAIDRRGPAAPRPSTPSLLPRTACSASSPDRSCSLPPLRRRSSDAVRQSGLAALLGAVDAAVDRARRLDAVADDAAAAVLATRRQGVDRALEAVEDVGRTLHHHLEGLIVVVSADFTSRHHNLLSVTWAGTATPVPRRSGMGFALESLRGGI